MNNRIVEILALASLVYYPPIPIVMTLIHGTLGFWRKLGMKSYYFFVVIFLAFDLLALGLVLHHKDSILNWRIYDNSWAFVGAVFLVSGFILGKITVKTLSWRVLFGIPEVVPSAQPSSLVTVGIYRYIRHPRYLEFILEVLGIAILSGLAVSYIVFLCFVVFMSLSAYIEEKELVTRFGSEYIKYKKRTGWFFPKILKAP